MFRSTIVVCVASAAVLTGCTDSPSPTPSVTTSSAEPSITASPSPTATATSATPSPSATSAWAAPAEWTPIDAADAGVDASTVKEVLGAWQLPDGGLASVVIVKNASATTDPDDYFAHEFSDFVGDDAFKVVYDPETTDAGEPAVVVTVTPTEDGGGDAQQFIAVLRPQSVTWASLSDDPSRIAESAAQLWALMRALPAT